MDSTCTQITDPAYAHCYRDARQRLDNIISQSEQDEIIGERMAFRRITVADMPEIFRFLKREEGRTTDFSYGGVVMWIDYFKYSFCIEQETLFIMGVLEDDRSVPAFSLPVGSLPLSRAVRILESYCRRHDIPLEFSAIPEHAVAQFRELAPREISELADWGDYLYDAEKLSTLSGKKMSKKRNHVNKFLNMYEGRWSFEALDGGNIGEALDFMDVFELEGDDTPTARAERQLTRRMIRSFPEMSYFMEGAVLRVDGKVCAVTLGDVKADTLYVHIEKATRNVEGSYEAINKFFAEEICRRYPDVKYINREDDAGDEGLRTAKQSYHPLEVLKKYNIRF